MRQIFSVVSSVEDIADKSVQQLRRAAAGRDRYGKTGTREIRRVGKLYETRLIGTDKVGKKVWNSKLLFAGQAQGTRMPR